MANAQTLAENCGMKLGDNLALPRVALGFDDNGIKQNTQRDQQDDLRDIAGQKLRDRIVFHNVLPFLSARSVSIDDMQIQQRDHAQDNRHAERTADEYIPLIIRHTLSPFAANASANSRQSTLPMTERTMFTVDSNTDELMSTFGVMRSSPNQPAARFENTPEIIDGRTEKENFIHHNSSIKKNTPSNAPVVPFVRSVWAADPAFVQGSGGRSVGCSPRSGEGIYRGLARDTKIREMRETSEISERIRSTILNPDGL